VLVTIMYKPSKQRANFFLDSGPGALQSGMWLWPASKALCFYLGERGLNEEWREILELGAGAGLAGLYCAQLASRRLTAEPATNILLTDRDYTSLKIMKKSIELNQHLWAPNIHVKTRRLLFVDGIPTAAQRDAIFPADLIIGTDLIYSDQVGRNLIQTLAFRFAKDRTWVFFLCSSFRHAETTSAVDDECAKHGIQRTVLAESYMNCLIEQYALKT